VFWTDTELVLVSLGAMLSPTTLSFSVFALVLGDRPLRTGLLFFLGAFGATLAIGILAAFVLGDIAATSPSSTPKTWVAIVDVVAAVVILVVTVRWLRRPVNPKRTESMLAQMSKVASSPAIAIVGAGAALANPGGFIPLALKAISETDPSIQGYIAQWLGFTIVSLLPLATAIVLLLVAPAWAERLLEGVRAWLQRRGRTVAAVILLLLAAALLRNGIAGLTG